MTHRHHRLVHALVLASLACAGAARAGGFDIQPHAGASVDHTSNVFLAPDGTPAGSDRPLAADTATTLLAGIELTEGIGSDSAYAKGEARRVRYQDFTELDHDEYNTSLGYRTGAENTDHLTAELGASRRLASFLSLASTTRYAIERERYGRLQGAWSTGNGGRFEGLAERRDVRSPIPGAPDYGQAEDIIRAGYMRDAGDANSYGARVEYRHGDYSGLTGLGSYRQWIPEGYFTHKVKNLVQMDLAVGATSRSQAGVANVRTYTGSFSISYQFTPRTRADASLKRTVNGYYANAGSQLDTSRGLALIWTPDQRWSASLDYVHTDSAVDATGFGARRDQYDSGSFNLAWHPNAWLSVGAYARNQHRNSSDAAYQFSGLTEGLTFTVQRPGRK